MLETMISLPGDKQMTYPFTGTVPSRTSTGAGGVLGGVHRAADGYVRTMMGRTPWEFIRTVLHDDRLVSPEVLGASNTERQRNRELIGRSPFRGRTIRVGSRFSAARGRISRG
jgi:hypothetical protein